MNSANWRCDLITPMFYINLERKPEVYEYHPEDYAEDLKEYGEKLDSYDWRVFDSEEKAGMWLQEYNAVLRGLDNARICNSRSLPAMLYKRRYMVQTIMGLKNQTYRHYLKPWKPGQLFNLHDQTYFLTVKLLRIEKTPQGFRYDFQR